MHRHASSFFRKSNPTVRFGRLIVANDDGDPLPVRLPCLVIGLAACTLLLVGCAVGPDFVRPDSGLEQAVLTPRDGVGMGESTPVPVPSRWWTLFNDDLLTALQAQARQGNLDLQAVAARIEQARAELGIATAQALPAVGLNTGYSREGQSAHGRTHGDGGVGDFWQLAFDAGWEIDLWGRVRRLREGAAATLEAARYDREAARVTLAAEIARAYIQLRGVQAQLDITRQNQATAEHTLALAESRERHGVATRFETASARAQLASVKAMTPELEQRRGALMNALALLLGEPPRTLDARLRDALPLPALSSSVPVGLSSELARRRPDILRAEAQLHAATAAIGVAQADFYPRIELRGRLGVEAVDARYLDTWDSRIFSIGPTVYLPIFQGGRLKQRLALSEARQAGAAIAFRQTVLAAWHEVDNALDAYAALQRQHAERLAVHEQSRQALHAAERGYQQGASDYLRVLTAQRDLLGSQLALNASATGAALALVNLYKALGGGWEPDAVQYAGSAGTAP